MSFVLEGVLQSIAFPLPLPLSRFCQPVELEPEPFMATWGALLPDSWLVGR